MKLFKVNHDDVIRTQNALWEWNEDDERFEDYGDTNPFDKSSVNAIYIHGKYSDKRAIDAGDLIEVSADMDYSGGLFTIIDIDVIDITELLDVAHKLSINISDYVASHESSIDYEPYEVHDLTKESARKEK